MVAHSRVSPFLIIVFFFFLILVGFVGSLCCLTQLLNPILSSNHLKWKSSEEVEVTHMLSRRKSLDEAEVTHILLVF